MLIIFCLAAALAATGLTFVMRKTAPVTGLLDIPKDERRMHGTPTPVGGGFAVYVAFSACILLFSAFGELPFAKYSGPLTVSGFIISAVGLIDDRFGLKAWMKILGQSVCGITLCLFGITVDKLSFFGNAVSLGWVKYPMTVLWIIAVTNVFNLIDGLDGLCTGITMISGLCICLVGIFDEISGASVCALIFVSACLGFLPHNANPAKIFPGDAGAMYFGFVLAYLTCISVYESETPTPALMPIVIFGIPVFDCFYAIVRRIASKKSIFEGDCGHVHHVLAKLYGMKKASLILCLFTVLFSGSALIMTAGVAGEIAGAGVFVLSVVVLAVFLKKANKNNL